MIDNSSVIYDYIIVGGGISGLYCAYKLSKIYKVLLLERTKRIGGRTFEKDFHNTIIELGAGIADESNKQLLALFKELNIDVKPINSQINDQYLPYQFDINSAINQIKAKYGEVRQGNKNGIIIGTNVDGFLEQYFGKSFKTMFYKYADYTDFHKQDINDYINLYPIDDIIRAPYKVYLVSWSSLANKLAQNIDYILGQEVNEIERKDDLFIINDKFQTKNIICCMTIESTKKLFDYPFLDEIGSIPFVRNYTYHPQAFTIPKGMNLTDNETKKILQINKNVLMASYCDSHDAVFWQTIYKVSKDEFKKVLSNKLLQVDKNITKFDDFNHSYWPSGIHYFKPIKEPISREEWIKKHMNPEKGIYIAGEMMSLRQGWVEGAIQSVNMLLSIIS